MRQWHAAVLCVPHLKGCTETQTACAALHPVGSSSAEVLHGSSASALHRWLGLHNALQVLKYELLLAGVTCCAQVIHCLCRPCR